MKDAHKKTKNQASEKRPAQHGPTTCRTYKARRISEQFLVCKGAKERSQFIEDTVYSTGISSGGLTAAFVTEAAIHKLSAYAAFLGGPTTWAATFGVGMTARMYLKRVADRRNVADRLVDGNQHLQAMTVGIAGG